MARTLTCPKCTNQFGAPEGHEGTRIPCPRCEQLVAVGGGSADVTVGKPAKRNGPDDGDEGDEDAPRRRGGFKPCPRCGADGAKRVLWTPWGSFYGPALLNHVRCRQCKYAYNGRTGGSNLVPAIFFVVIPLVLLAGIIGFVAMMLMRMRY